MTFKNTTKISLLIAIMIIPLTASNAYSDGSAQIVSICSFTPPGSISYGSITRGIDSDEVDITLVDAATEVTTIELQAGDWFGDEDPQKATAIITLNDYPTSADIIIGGVAYESIFPNNGDAKKFYVGGTDHQDAEHLAQSINEWNQGGGPFLVSALAVDNTVIVSAYTGGTFGNDITLEYDHPTWYPANPYVEFSSFTLEGGTDTGLVHLQSEVTRFNITTDGSDSSGTTYAEKTAIGQDGAFTTLTTEAQPFTDVNLSFQITGKDPALENMPYSGSVTQSMLFTFSCTE